MLNILFVCTGNTCRSPMAQALMNFKAGKESLPLYAKSAGLAAFCGDAPSENAVLAMREIGIDIESHRSSSVNTLLLDESDLVVCMSQSHKSALLPYTDEKKLLCVPGGVPDPYGGDLDAYRECRDALSDYIDTLIETLSKPIIKPLCKSSVGDVARLEKECFSAPWSENALAEELLNDTAHFFVASRFGETAGYIGTSIVLDECYVSNLAVAEKHRRNGVGAALLDRAEAEARSLGCRFISLEVREGNAAAISLYEKHGFEPCGLRKNFYSRPQENGLIMTKFFDKE